MPLSFFPFLAQAGPPNAPRPASLWLSPLTFLRVPNLGPYSARTALNPPASSQDIAPPPFQARLLIGGSGGRSAPLSTWPHPAHRLLPRPAPRPAAPANRRAERAKLWAKYWNRSRCRGASEPAHTGDLAPGGQRAAGAPAPSSVRARRPAPRCLCGAGTVCCALSRAGGAGVASFPGRAKPGAGAGTWAASLEAGRAGKHRGAPPEVRRRGGPRQRRDRRAVLGAGALPSLWSEKEQVAGAAPSRGAHPCCPFELGEEDRVLPAPRRRVPRGAAWPRWTASCTAQGLRRWRSRCDAAELSPSAASAPPGRTRRKPAYWGWAGGFTTSSGGARQADPSDARLGCARLPASPRLSARSGAPGLGSSGSPGSVCSLRTR